MKIIPKQVKRDNTRMSNVPLPILKKKLPTQNIDNQTFLSPMPSRSAALEEQAKVNAIKNEAYNNLEKTKYANFWTAPYANFNGKTAYDLGTNLVKESIYTGTGEAMGALLGSAINKGISKIATKKRFGSKPITEAERAGIPKGERKSPSPYKQIGTVTESKSKKETLTVDSPIFGNFVDNGSQQTVFQNTLDPSKVLKVYTERKFTSAPEIKEFHKQWMKRNRLPLQERINFEGYLQGDNRIYPVYSQNKITPIGDTPMVTWEKQFLPQINSLMHNLGYKGKGTYTNGKLTVGDIDPWNVGYNQSGELRFFDADVYKVGGRIIFRNK